MFKPVTEVNFPELEKDVLEFWQTQRIFQKTLEKDAPQGNYVFFEGPPTANGFPGVHHILSRAFKDLFPRFKTMQGYRVDRKGGWDTHGLPVEIAVEKRLGFKRKTEIDDYGIDKFNALAKSWVFENIKEWNTMTERIGYWIDLEQAYVTYDNSYIESCWWVFKSLWNQGLLKEDYRTTWHCPRNNTSLASHEVSLGYKEDTPDPSIYPKFPADMASLVAAGIVEADSPQVYFMAWTTTPWTLAANTALAVSDSAEYGLYRAPVSFDDFDPNPKKKKSKKKKQAKAEASSENEVAAPPPTLDDVETELYIIATGLETQAFGEGKFERLKTFSGSSLVNARYKPLLQAHVPEGEDLSKGYRVIADTSVTIDDGTGVLHVAPAYGDLEIGKQFDLPTIFSVDLLGEVYPEVKLSDDTSEGDGTYTKQFFKDADKPIIKDLLAKGLMYRSGTIKHTYPFNWRDGTPLINYAKRSWYIRTSKVKEQLVANNQKINWTPEHIRDGRFGNWLENNIDWAVSRERYWGCPLPIWEAEDGTHYCVGSLEELAKLSGRDDLTELELHRPYVDNITFEIEGKTFKRIPYTVDVWFESGAMPYAQWHFMGRNKEDNAEANKNFMEHFPADYICEAVDQTRGWFYSLHALATLLTYQPNEADGEIPAGVLADAFPNQSAYKNVICLGLLLDEKGEKMSKSKGNTIEPIGVLDRQGADATRWYMYSSAPPGNTRRFSEDLVAETLRDFFYTLWNTYSFFVLYANLDEPNLSQAIPVADRPDIDRWLVARLHQVIADVTESLEAYDATTASRTLRDFVVDDVSNWYVRRNRRRFWKGENETNDANTENESNANDGHKANSNEANSSNDKLAAYHTLYETLTTVAQLMAPMAPFFSEYLYQALVRSLDESVTESIHLTQWPEVNTDYIDKTLLRDMNALIRVVELGRSARAASKLKVRQPLPEVLVRVREQDELEGLKQLEPQILAELNVKSVTYLDVTTDFVDYTIRPNLPRIGKRLGKLVPNMRKALNEIDSKVIAGNVRDGVNTTIELEGKPWEFEPEAFLLDAQSPEGYVAVEEKGYLAALNTQLTPELIKEGLMRDVIRHVQESRKQAGLEVSNRIRLTLVANNTVQDALAEHLAELEQEVLATSIIFADQEVNVNTTFKTTVQLDEETPLVIGITKVNPTT